MEFNIDDLLGSGGGFGVDSFTGTGANVPMDWQTGALDFSSPGVDSMTGAAPTGGGGMMSGLSDAASGIGAGIRSVTGPLGDVAKSVLPIAQIGTGIMGAVGNIQAAGNLADQSRIQRQGLRSQLDSATQAREMAGNVSAPAGTLVNFGQEQINRAQAGEVDPAMQSIIDRWKNGAKQQMLQRLASSGQATSSTAAQLDQILEQMAVSMKGELLQSMKAQGVGATQAGGGLLASGASASAGAGQTAGGVNQAALQQSQVLQNLIGSANQALARIGAGASVT